MNVVPSTARGYLSANPRQHAAFIRDHGRPCNSQPPDRSSYRRNIGPARCHQGARDGDDHRLQLFHPSAGARVLPGGTGRRQPALANPNTSLQFAATHYRSLEVPFETFFAAYEQYQRDSAAGTYIRPALRRLATRLSGVLAAKSARPHCRGGVSDPTTPPGQGGRDRDGDRPTTGRKFRHPRHLGQTSSGGPTVAKDAPKQQ